MKRGLSLVEMLVAMAVTLVMMGAVVTMFGNVAGSISGSRAMMEISERVRNCRNVLQRDLDGITATMLPPRSPESAEGYFEYVEGPMTDLVDVPLPLPTTLPDGFGLRGDSDDVLMFTTRSSGDLFAGTVNGDAAQSRIAEVVYFTAVAPNMPTIVTKDGVSLQLKTLYRRVLLIDPARGTVSGSDYQATNDLSGRIDGTNFIANNLADVTKRENRYGHPAGTPFEVVLPGEPTATIVPLATVREGEDVILTNVLAFDVRAFDPGAPVSMADTIACTPGDPGHDPKNPVSFGAYVDLGYAYDPSQITTVPPSFVPPRLNNLAFNAKSGLTLPTYDTWSTHYESAGIDGLDSNGNGIVDDVLEQQAPPPYAAPLRGVRVKIRVYEPDSRQVREVTLVSDFVGQ